MDAVREILIAVRDAASSAEGVRVDDDAVEHVLALASVRFSHRREPDKSKDLLEQAIAGALAHGSVAVDRAAIDAAADSLAGVPAVGGAGLAALEATLIARGLLPPTGAAALVERIGLTLSGLGLRPRRPRAVVLVLDDQAVRIGDCLASTVAEFVFGAPERVVTIDVGSIKEPSMLSGLVGTTQGYVGFGMALPIHEVAQKPFSVVRFLGIDASHPSVRALIAQVIFNGYLSDAMGRRIYLSSAVVFLEAGYRADPLRGFGFAAGVTTPRDGDADPPTVAVALVGEELTGECDLIVSPPRGLRIAGRGSIASILRELADSYRVAGVELTWSTDVEHFLADAAANLSTPRLRERRVEEQLGRVVRPHLQIGSRPVRLTVDVASSALIAEVRPAPHPETARLDSGGANLDAEPGRRLAPVRSTRRVIARVSSTTDGSNDGSNRGAQPRPIDPSNPVIRD